MPQTVRSRSPLGSEGQWTRQKHTSKDVIVMIRTAEYMRACM
jgi:hypothetical protein